MKRRILSLLCALAILLGMVTVPAFAAETPAAINGAQEYGTLQEAVDAFSSGVITLEQDASAITVTKDVYIDLNGYTLTGVTVTGGTLFVKDAKTDDYTVADGIYGKLTDVSGAVEAAEGYMQITEGETVSFHAVNLKINGMALRPGEAGVYYTSLFAGDEMVAQKVEAFGVALSASAEPNAENMDTLCGYSAFTGFVGGKTGNQSANGTLLTGIMKPANSDGRNTWNAGVDVYGRAYIKTNDGYLFGDCVARNLMEQVEAIDTVWSSLTSVQKVSILSMYGTYESVMTLWNVPNMKNAFENPGSEEPDDDAVIVMPIPVTIEDGKVAETVTVEQDGYSVTVPAGVLLAAGADKLTLVVTVKDSTDSGVTLEENQVLLPLDVHVDGVSVRNTVPLTVSLGKQLPENLNLGNYDAYHVENGSANEMTLIPMDALFTAHNQYKYTLDGEIILHMATFSEVTLTANNENIWNGERNYDWYDADAELLEIRNADQLAGFGAIVGGMAKTADGVAIEQDSFANKTVKLLADINIGDTVDGENDELVFYPIGYYCSDGLYGKTGVAVTSGFYTFEGIFDGNGNTISNFYQNTWEMKGDHNWYDAELQYFRDGMGLFGKVYGGTVKNLIIDNFQCDGEIATTGVIAAYADSYSGKPATFENITIVNCNPRVYNIGNGGIVGCAGWYSKDTQVSEAPVTFKNITVDQTNKISALWGSYDVACGGILGQYYPDSGSGVYFENCHVAAEMDVNNDVCGNYQYYWYRYAGMFIGTLRNNTTDANGYTVGDTTGITAKNCTYTMGDWNEYWYCELVANSLASYTHDHQFSRLTKVDAVDAENMTVTVGGESTAIPASGRYNYVVVDGENLSENATCYHFVDGEIWNHEDGGFEDFDLDENGALDDLKEDRTCYFMPFAQLMTGNGWGVKAHLSFEGNDEIDITEVENGTVKAVEKFDVITEQTAFEENATVKISDLFAAKSDVTVSEATVHVFVSPVGEDSTVDSACVYVTNGYLKDIADLTLTGTGAAKITITDYIYCKPTVLYVTVGETVQTSVEKFDKLFDQDFLYRVGNQNSVAVGKLFAAKQDAEIGTVAVTVEPISSGVSGTHTPNETWTNGTLQFTGTGVVKVIITDNNNCIPTELILEVVDAKNVTGATSATANNVVLLNDCGLSSLTVSGRYTFYGNGFTMTYTGNGQYLGKGSGFKFGVVNVSEHGTLDNCRIKSSIYPVAALFSDQIADYYETDANGKTRYFYQLSAVAVSGNATVANCYIYGGRNNLYIGSGNVTVRDSVLESGVLSNAQIVSSEEYTVKFENVTTIQQQINPTTYANDSLKNNVLFGAGIIVGPETNSNPKLVLNGEFKQYNWSHYSDYQAVTDETAKEILAEAYAAQAFHHTVDGDPKTANLGVIYLNTYDLNVENNTGLPYDSGTISMYSESGQVYTLKNASADQIYWDLATADRFTVNGLYQPQFKYSADLGGQYEEALDVSDTHCYREDDTIRVMFPMGDTKELDVVAMVNIEKYTGQDLNLTVSCKDGSGNAVAVTDGKVTLSTAGDYTVTYAVTDAVFYDKDGNAVTGSINYSWDVTVSVSLKDTSIPNAYYEFDSSKQVIYRSGNSSIVQFIPFLAGLKIYDYTAPGQEAYLRFDGDNDFNKIAKASINNINTTGEAQGYHIVTVELVDGGKLVIDMDVRANSGSSTHSGSIKVRNNVMYVVNGGTTSGKGQTWKIYSYKFIGNNGVEIDSGLVTFGTSGVDCDTATKPTSNFGTTVKYTVTYDANGGDCGQTTGYATSVSSAVTLPTPRRSSYIFVGWYTAASGGTKVGDAGESYTPTANITLYAQWGAPCTVTYDANGGSCDVSSERYSGEALILPTPVRDGYWFTGWYDAAADGKLIGDAGTTYNPTGEITLYAHWQEAVEYTVTYNANGGTCSTASATYQGSALVLPTPSREGHTFSGWYTAASGGEKAGDAGASYFPTANTTLYAQWTVNSYTITADINNATVKVNGNAISDNGTVSVAYGTQVTVEVTYSASENQSTTIKGADGTTYTSPFSMPAQSVTITASSEDTCIIEGTLITMADGTQKPVEELRVGDMLLAFNHVTGEFEAAPLIFNTHGNESAQQRDVLTLEFSDGNEIGIVASHGFFDMTLMQYVYITNDNYKDYIGHAFYSAEHGGAVTLTNAYLEQRLVRVFCPVTYFHMNSIANGMLNTPNIPGGITGLVNYFEYDADLKYNEEAMQRDIEQYGLYTYDDFKEYISYEAYLSSPSVYLKVAVGKGMITYEQILDVIFYLLEGSLIDS